MLMAQGEGLATYGSTRGDVSTLFALEALCGRTPTANLPRLTLSQPAATVRVAATTPPAINSGEGAFAASLAIDTVRLADCKPQLPNM